VFCPGVPVTSTETFRWLEGGYFLVQEYETTFGDEPTQRGVNYWGYAAVAGRFLIIFFSNNGPFTEEGNRYEGKVADGRLTFVGPARFQYELDENGKDQDERGRHVFWLGGYARKRASGKPGWTSRSLRSAISARPSIGLLRNVRATSRGRITERY
jgi:hypothetical protein